MKEGSRYFITGFHIRYPFLEGQHGKERDGELGDDEDRGYRTELGVHRHIVDEKVGQRHEVLTP